jgi:flagellin
MSALTTLNGLNQNSHNLSKSLEKVSTGMRVVGAADDVSGYAISERMRVMIRALGQANDNTQNARSMMKVADGAISSTVEILKTMKEKVIGAANDSNTDADRLTIQKELDQSIDQIDDNANVTFNGKYLVDGSKNTRGDQTYTSLTNLYLSTDTTGDTELKDFADRNGNSLNIQTTDSVTVSFVHGAKTYTTTFSANGASLNTVVANMNTLYQNSGGTGDVAVATVLDDKIVGTDRNGNTVYTTNGEKGVTIQAAKSGVDNQLAGLTISVSDRNGNVKKSVNSVLDVFTESVRAEDVSQENGLVFQIGSKSNQAIRVGLTDMRSRALGLKSADGTTLNISTQKQANAAINVLDNALQRALFEQTTIGAIGYRMEFTSDNLTVASDNVTNSESVYRDADMAKEMAEYTRSNVLLQAAQSMLAQANQNSSSVLSLLQ